MRKLYSYIKVSRKQQIFLLSLILTCITLYGCFKLKSIDHPATAEINSHFDVTFVCEPDVSIKTEGKGYFGVLLPVGWTPQEVTDYTVFFPDNDNANGHLRYNEEYTNGLRSKIAAPPGYYWWGGRSDDDMELIKKVGDNEIKCTDFSFKFRIYTDDQTGDFDLRYLIATNANNEDPTDLSSGIHVDVTRTISIAGQAAADEIKIQQPANQHTYSFTDVDISYTSVRINNINRVYFGALLPKGWRVEDYTDCKVTDKNGVEAETGRFSYDQYYSDQLEASYASPQGYYWWGGRTIDNLPMNSTDNNLSFKFRIYNDHQTGDFNLRYVIGAGPDSAIKDYLKEETYYPITITQGNQFPIKKEPNWVLLPNNESNPEDRWDENIKFYSDKDYDGFFTRWYGWNGGDVGISSLLNDGRSIWVWGDSHTGVVTSNRARLTDQAQFERNFIIAQDGEDFSAFKMINEGSPSGQPNGKVKEALIPTDDEGVEYDKHTKWYWPNGSSVYYRNGVPELHMVLSRMQSTPGGTMWSMIGEAADVAVFSLPDLKLKDIIKFKHRMANVEVISQNDKGEDVKSVYSLGYAGQVFKDDDGAVYVYGNAGYPGICTTTSFVARAKNGDLTGEWEYYNAGTKQWSTDTSWQEWAEGTSPDATFEKWHQASLKQIYIDGDGKEQTKNTDKNHFVFKDGGKYYAFGIGVCFGRNLYIYDADTPYGPFRNERLVGRLPAEISEGYVPSLPDVHHQFSKNGELLLSICKNYDDNARISQGLPPLSWYNVPGCADEYRPYFFRSKNWRDKLNISNLDATDNKGILTAEYGEKAENLTDNNENTIYTASSGSAWVQYQSLTPVNLRRYTITSATDAPEKDPLHWKVLASNDGENWTTIDERYYADFEERSQTINYIVPIDGEFTYFRLHILASKGGGELQIAEWQMFGKFEYEKESIAELESIIVNNKPVTEINDVIFIDVLSTDPVEHIIDLKAKNYGTLDNKGNLFTVLEEKPGIFTYRLEAKPDEPGTYIYDLKVISEDGTTEKDYKLVLSRRYPFDNVIKVKWNNTLMLYLNEIKKHNVTGYQWYKNDSPMNGETGTSYSAGPKKDNLLDQSSAYHIVMKTPDGDIRSESKQVTLKSMGVQAYPNPVKVNEAIIIEADIEEELLTGATVEIYNIGGNKVSNVKVQGRSTTINAPSAAGTYMFKFKSNNQFEKTIKIVVK